MGAMSPEQKALAAPVSPASPTSPASPASPASPVPPSTGPTELAAPPKSEGVFGKSGNARPSVNVNFGNACQSANSRPSVSAVI
jgi:hypothetical protein